MDVKNVFLSSDLQEEVYMVLSTGVSHNPREACKLKKALYGLKQVSLAQSAKFFNVLTSLGFHPSHHDSTLLLKYTTIGHILLSLHVDELIIISMNCQWEIVCSNCRDL